MLIDSDYRGYRIEVVAFEIEGAWDADVRIRLRRSEATACAGHLTCRQPTPVVAEENGAMYARRWIDRHGRP